MKARLRPEIVITVGVLVLILAGRFLLHGPQHSELVSVASDVLYAEESLTYALENGDDIQRAGEFLPAPLGDEGDGDQRFLIQVSGKLRELGMTPKTIQPKEELRNGEYMTRSYVIEIECGYAELVEFLDYLENLPELVLVEFLDVQSSTLLARGGEHSAVLGLTFIGH